MSKITDRIAHVRAGLHSAELLAAAQSDDEGEDALEQVDRDIEETFGELTKLLDHFEDMGLQLLELFSVKAHHRAVIDPNGGGLRWEVNPKARDSLRRIVDLLDGAAGLRGLVASLQRAARGEP